MTKAEARTQARAQRAALSPEERTRLSEALTQVFLESVYVKEVRCLNAFLPLARHHEPDLRPLLAYLHAEHPLIQLTVPHLIPGSDDFDAVGYHPAITLQKGGHGTEIPAEPVPVSPLAIDLVLVPLLAYDQRGYRAGYGGGYYDRFLSRCRPDVRKIGVSFFGPIPRLDDVWHGDIRLDACLTPTRLQSF